MLNRIFFLAVLGLLVLNGCQLQYQATGVDPKCIGCEGEPVDKFSLLEQTAAIVYRSTPGYQPATEPSDAPVIEKDLLTAPMWLKIQVSDQTVFQGDRGIPANTKSLQRYEITFRSNSCSLIASVTSYEIEELLQEANRAAKYKIEGSMIDAGTTNLEIYKRSGDVESYHAGDMGDGKIGLRDWRGVNGALIRMLNEFFPQGRCPI